jgi:hypothetical protein
MDIITKDNIYDQVWSNFKDLLKANLTNITLSDGTIINVPRVTNSFPQNKIDDENTYPTVVIENPSLPSDILTSKKSQINGTISISVYATQSQTATKYLSQIRSIIETNKKVLSGYKIRNIEFGTNTYNQAVRGGFSVHVCSLTLEFLITYEKEVGY